MWELCRQWEQGDTFKDYSLVVLIKLCDRGMQEIQHTADLFYHNDMDLRAAVSKEVTWKEGESVLFLLDSFDEAPQKFQQNPIFCD